MAMYGLYLIMTVLVVTWTKDECMALTAAERTREQIKLARAAIRRSDMAPSYLHIAEFGHPKGRGIVAGKDFAVGDFITYYHGRYCVKEPIFDEYTFDLEYSSHAAWIDASQEDGSYGRLINDEWRNPNMEAREIFVDGRSHIAFLALTSIKKGQEINFNYNRKAYFPWRQTSETLAHPYCIRPTWEEVFYLSYRGAIPLRVNGHISESVPSDKRDAVIY